MTAAESARIGGVASGALLLATTMLLAAAPSVARAEGERSVVHPIFSTLKDAPQNDLAVQRFGAAVRRFGLGPIETVDVVGDPPPQTADKLRAGIALVRNLELARGQAILDEAATEVAASGGAGLDAAALSDLFLYRAWATSRADFNVDHAPTPTARALGYDDLTRAVMMVPGRQLNPQQFPPLVLEDWARALAEVGARAQSTLTVKTSTDALVSCDGASPIPGPATFVGVAQGPHLIHVDEPGWAGWGATISVDQAAIAVELPPRRALSLGDAEAAARARRMGAKFALVAEPRPGQGRGLTLSLRLVDATGVRRDSAVEPLAGDDSSLDAAVMRLDEQARRWDRDGVAPAGPRLADATSEPLPALPPPVLIAPPPVRPRLRDDPGGWARDHWPLLTAVGAMLGAALVLSLAMASDH